jgi:RNA polymerase sigma-70 factor (ECF subfamily)
MGGSTAAGRGMADETSWITRIPGPFEELFQEEYRQMAALAYALTGRWDVAEDLAQEAFLRAHRDWARVGAMEYPGAWLRRVVTNLAISRWRRLRSEAIVALRLHSEAAVPPPEPDHAAFWDEVRGLPKRQRQVIALRYVEDLTVGEIARILGVADGTVKALLHHGRSRLRERLAAKGLAP